MAPVPYCNTLHRQTIGTLIPLYSAIEISTSLSTERPLTNHARYHYGTGFADDTPLLMKTDGGLVPSDPLLDRLGGDKNGLLLSIVLTQGPKVGVHIRYVVMIQKCP
jgi:hypothetical protein